MDFNFQLGRELYDRKKFNQEEFSKLLEVCTLYTGHCTLYTGHWTLFSVHFTLKTVYWTLYTVN